MVDSAVGTSFLAEVPLKEALNGPYSKEWLEAITSKMRRILENDTWTMVNRPMNEKMIGSRIVLRNKYRQDGTIERRKARLVARDFAQRPGVNFKESFASMARLGSIRSILKVLILCFRLALSLSSFKNT